MAAVSDHFISLLSFLFLLWHILSFLLFFFFYSARGLFILKVHISFFWRAGVDNVRDQRKRHLGGKGDGTD